MGSSNWSDSAYSSLKEDYSTQSTQQIFSQKATDVDMNPKGVKFRESRDSNVHPNSVAVIVALDETGSMGQIPEVLIREKLGSLMTTLITHGVPDAHVMFMGIGDHYSDDSPLQVGQFEAGTEELNKWLTKIFLEGRGGGNGGESYSLAWLFAARHTSIDCFEKRGQKGFLFTIGDENFHKQYERNNLEKLLGTKFEADITATQLLKEVSRTYNVFHLQITEGSGSDSSVVDNWKSILGERVILVEDYNTVAEIVASTVAVVLGADLKNVVSGFDDHTARQVGNALIKVTNSVVAKQKEGIVKL